MGIEDKNKLINKLALFNHRMGIDQKIKLQEI